MQQFQLMQQFQKTLSVETHGRGLKAITDQATAFVAGRKLSAGLLTLFCRHTSASLLIQENADPAVLRDLESFFGRIAPEDGGLYTHNDEGPDDMPAHIRAALTQTSLSILVVAGRLAIGAWQGIYLFEHRRTPHRREIVLHLIGD
jgi:secondary thiamine-phosphate synthase enzyme